MQVPIVGAETRTGRTSSRGAPGSCPRRPLHTRDLFSGSTTGEARGNDAGEPSLAVFGFQWNLNRHAGSLCCLKIRRPPYRPYLTFSPSAFVFPLKFTGGGYSGGGKLMIDSQGNAWVADSFLPGSQNQDASWTGTLSKFAPNGKALSPSPFGFTGGGPRRSRFRIDPRCAGKRLGQ